MFRLRAWNFEPGIPMPTILLGLRAPSCAAAEDLMHIRHHQHHHRVRRASITTGKHGTAQIGQQRGWELGFRVQGLGFRVLGFGFRVLGSDSA